MRTLKSIGFLFLFALFFGCATTHESANVETQSLLVQPIPVNADKAQVQEASTTYRPEIVEEIAREKIPEDKITLDVKSKWLSRYVDTSGSVVAGDPIIQSEVAIGFPIGWYAAFIHYTEITSNLRDNDGAEIDLYGGKVGEILGLNYDIGLAFFNYARILNIKGSYLQPYGELFKETDLSSLGKIEPFVRVEPQIPLGEGDFASYFHLGTRHRIETEWFEVKNCFSFVGDTGAYEMDPGVSFRYALEIDIPVSENVSIDLSPVQLNVPVYKMDDRDTEVVYGGGISLKWSF